MSSPSFSFLSRWREAVTMMQAACVVCFSPGRQRRGRGPKSMAAWLYSVQLYKRIKCFQKGTATITTTASRLSGQPKSLGLLSIARLYKRSHKHPWRTGVQSPIEQENRHDRIVSPSPHVLSWDSQLLSKSAPTAAGKGHLPVSPSYRNRFSARLASNPSVALK